MRTRAHKDETHVPETTLKSDGNRIMRKLRHSTSEKKNEKKNLFYVDSTCGFVENIFAISIL